MPTAVEQILWTAVPNGFSNGNLQLSVHVSPQLSGGATGTLTDFTDFQSWPSVIGPSTSQSAAAAWGNVHVVFTDKPGTVLKAITVPIASNVLRNDLWQALFLPAVQYSARDAGEPYDTVPIVSYPADQVAGFLQQTYTNLAVTSPSAYPMMQPLLGVYEELGYVGAQGIAELNALWGDLSNERLGIAVTHGGPVPYANDWTGATPQTALAALRFYHMAAQGAPAAATLPAVDFHRALTFIGEHAALQRALGLVLDVELPVANLGFLQRLVNTTPWFVSAFVSDSTGGAAFSSAQSGVSTTNLTPRTQITASTTFFEAFATSSEIVGGQLTLGDQTSFAVYEIDVDGGGLHTTQFADNLALAQEPQSADGASANGPAPDAPGSYALPALRSAGLTVAVVNRGIAFANRLQRGAALLSGASASPPAIPDLTAEDLVKGYVLDVYDGSVWRSTSMRDVTYVATGVSPSISVTGDEPGTDAPPRMQFDPTDSSQQQLNLPANIIRWNGWSNAAPRPGSPLNADGSSGVQSGGAGNGPFDQLTITAAATAGSLPPLRYGNTYALRARIVDIAGNVIPLGAGADVGDPENRVSPQSVFGRHEPIGSPDIYSWNPPLPGESLKLIVIRDIDTLPSSVRALAPSRIAESFAELHGVFDTRTSSMINGNVATYDLITSQESQRYTPGTAISFTASVPYLPDPLAAGVTLTMLDAPFANDSYQLSFSHQAWPAYQPLGLELVPAVSIPTVNIDDTNHQIVVGLAQGDTVTAQVSSYVAITDLPKLGMYQWLSTYFHGSVPSSLTNQITGGLVWAITPYTTVQFVYAVQKPLLVPTIASPLGVKHAGWTYEQLSGNLTYSPKSTARTDLLASWGDPVDNGPGTGVPQGPGSSDTTLAPRQSTVLTMPSSYTQDTSATEPFAGQHQFFDTKHREVTYTAKSTSRFTEHYQGSTSLTVPSPGTATPLALPGHPGLGLEPGSVTVAGSDGTVYPSRSFTIDAGAGTISFVANAGGPATGSTVHVDFLPPVTVDSAPFNINVLSSTRPLAPDIVSIVPIYKWSKIDTHGKDTVSARSPSALRVFMTRAWWSSGIGELLGVLTWPDAENTDLLGTIPDPENLYVSDWGADPVFASHPLPWAHPRLRTFTKRVQTQRNLPIDENPTVRVNVAGHTVEYDPIRDLWYADIVADIGASYTPMLRMALARYQPDSVKGLELSRIILADIMSLEPGRAAIVIRHSPTLLKAVEIGGYSYRIDGDDSDTAYGYAELVIERRVPEIHDEVIGWEPVSKPQPMTVKFHKGGFTTWNLRDVKIPARGTHRLFITQYEKIPQLPRGNQAYSSFEQGIGLRIVYQDLIPI